MSGERKWMEKLLFVESPEMTNTRVLLNGIEQEKKNFMNDDNIQTNEWYFWSFYSFFFSRPFYFALHAILCVAREFFSLIKTSTRYNEICFIRS